MSEDSFPTLRDVEPVSMAELVKGEK